MFNLACCFPWMSDAVADVQPDLYKCKLCCDAYSLTSLCPQHEIPGNAASVDKRIILSLLV